MTINISIIIVLNSLSITQLPASYIIVCRQHISTFLCLQVLLLYFPNYMNNNSTQNRLQFAGQSKKYILILNLHILN